MIKALSFAAFLVIGLWYAPWWSIALLGIVYGLTHKGNQPWMFCAAYSFLTFVLVFALIWISESHSGFRAGQFLSSYLATPKAALYALSALIFSLVTGLGCLTGSFLSLARRVR